MKILITIIFLLTPNYLFANTNTFNCVFSFSEYINKQQPIGKDIVKLMQWDEIKIFADFSSISKKKWVIDKIYLEKDLKQTLDNIFDNSSENLFNSFSKILYDEKLSGADKQFRKYLLKELGVSLSELEQSLKKLSKKEKEQALREFKIEFKRELNLFYKEFGNALDDITINQEQHFKHYINTFEKYGELKVMGNKIEAKTVTDAGMLIENIIDYNQLLKNESKDTVSLKMTFVDGNSALFSSKCFNTSNLIINKDNNKSNEIETKLRKLKLLYEDELITQEEYDAKRKEILDEM